MINVIVNSSSGSEKKDLVEKTIKPYLSQAGEEYKILYSEKPGDIARLASELTSGDEPGKVRILLLGGDGSINELLSGIKDTSKVILSLIPTGSGNDFARSVGIPAKNVKLALDIAVKRGRTAVMDLGEITYPEGDTRKFIISSGMGFDAAVCEKALHSALKKKLNKVGLGKLSYGLIAFKEIFNAKRPDGTISFDGGEEIPLRKLLFVAFMNEPFEGGGFKFAPDASHSDGILDICVVHKVSKLIIPVCLPMGLFGKHYAFKDINEYHASKIHIHTNAPMWVHTDGEVKRQADDLKIRVIKSALNITLP